MYEQLITELKEKEVQLVAVSKTKPAEQILAMYELGQRIFGENRVPELVEKEANLPKDIEWHMIGHLQRNKVKYIAPFVHTIHSVDTSKLLKEINKQAAKHDRIIHCLLQFKIAKEDTKSGFDLETAKSFLEDINWEDYQNVCICGVMGMATFTSNKEQVRQEFQQLRHIFNELQSAIFSNQSAFKEISMGMSGDYGIAIEEGSTMVRIGSLIFGPRN